MDSRKIEKSFVEIGQDIDANGLETTFAMYTQELLYSIQNFTRIVGDLLTAHPDLEKELNGISGMLMIGGIEASEVAKRFINIKEK